MNGNGDCFEVAGNIVALFDKPYALGDSEKAAIMVLTAMDVSEDDLVLVHGLVRRSTDGFQHVHAWVEIPEMRLAVDFSNGHNTVMPREHYRNLGQAERTFEFTPEQAQRMLLEHETYGPWPTEGEKP